MMRSIRPGLRRASSIASGRLVAATTRTSFTVEELIIFNLRVLCDISTLPYSTDPNSVLINCSLQESLSLVCSEKFDFPSSAW